MPKLKTNRSANKSHILEKKSPKQKRRLSNKVVCKKGDTKIIIKYLV